MKRIPLFLLVFRAIAGPLLIVGAFTTANGVWLATLVTLAFLSDVFDGIIARRVGVSTDALRLGDSVVDTAFYVAAVAAVFVRAPHVLRDAALPIAILVALEIVRYVVELAKFGRIAAYHMWSAKAWGIALWLGFAEVFVTRQGGPLFHLAVIVGILADLEGLAASALLRTWQRDVATVWEALDRERSEQYKLQSTAVVGASVET